MIRILTSTAALSCMLITSAYAAGDPILERQRHERAGKCMHAAPHDGTYTEKPSYHGQKYSHKEKMMFFFNEIDTNRDGYISPSEHAAFVDDKWKEIDVNNDNRLSKNEMIKYKRDWRNEQDRRNHHYRN